MIGTRAITACCISLLVLVCSAGSTGLAFAYDCAKAKEFYALGTKLFKYEERRAAFQKAVDLCPSYAEAYCNLADAVENLGMLKKGLNEKSLTQGNTFLDTAVKYYKKAIELNPGLYQARLGLGEIYTGCGQYLLAENEYRKVLELRPGDETAKEGLQAIAECKERRPIPGVKSSGNIIKEAKESRMDVADKVMGIEDHTVKDRQAFENILFEGWSARIVPGEPTHQVTEIGKALSSGEMASFGFVIEGHTNIVGGPEENMKLSWDRARSVQNHLVRNYKIDPTRIVVQGFGYTRPKFLPENDPRNRRVEILFLQQTSSK